MRPITAKELPSASAWLDFFPIDGQQTPAPARYVGGIHDMPRGSTGYFRVDLQPGVYGLTAEIPDAAKRGLFERVSVTAP